MGARAVRAFQRHVFLDLVFDDRRIGVQLLHHYRLSGDQKKGTVTVALAAIAINSCATAAILLHHLTIFALKR